MINIPTIGIIDTGTSNIQSVTYALKECNSNVIHLSNFDDNLKIDALVVPGIGSFGEVMEQLRKRKLDKLILNFVQKETPILFICVGMQILFSESSEFGNHTGLNIFKGKVKKIKHDYQGKKRKIPFIGWNKIIKKKNCKIFKDIKDHEFFYFTHSFYVEPADDLIISSNVDYLDFKYCSSVSDKNIFATQFHPEKSGSEGIKIYKNFINLIEKK
ncbi:MAG: imidazole glycerol phosphate synthase subunit HisH [Pelagibacteraceae bacterium TMED65]|nr:MAG: imidazole glycerol phosphate synthase subunit HisH [Pelagibacteraceae bacterium TMED65]